jgi:signal transduction histidine kinase
MLLLMSGVCYLFGLLGPLGTLSFEHPAQLLLLGYAGLALITTIMLFIRTAHPLLLWTYVLDILVISLLMLVSGEYYAVFYPFYIFPLLYVATNQQPITSLISGFATALFYIAVVMYLLWLADDQDNLVRHEEIAFGLQSLVLVVFPWVTSNLTLRRVDTRTPQQALRQVQAYRDQMHAFFHVAETLSGMADATRDFKQVLQTALQQIPAMMPYQAGVILISSGRPRELTMLVGDPLHPSDQGKSIDIGDSTIAAILGGTSSATHLSLPQEPALQQVATLHECQSACLVPLRAGLRTYGVLVIASKNADSYTSEHLEMLTALANYILVTLHMTQVSSQLKAAQRDVRSKEQNVRTRIARHLHDGPTQQIAAFAMQTDFIKQCFANRDGKRAMNELESLGDLARRINQEMRLTLAELRPIKLETEGLQPALSDYIERVRSRTEEMNITLDMKDATNLLLPKETEAILFDIIQESINNAIKYSQAHNLLVRISREGETCVVSIRDDGKGFDVAAQMEAAAKRGSYGLRNFHERVEMLGGTSTIESAPGKGTLVQVTVPLAAS